MEEEANPRNETQENRTMSDKELEPYGFGETLGNAIERSRR